MLVVIYWHVSGGNRWKVLLAANYIFYTFAGIQYLAVLLYVTLTSFYLPTIFFRLDKRRKVLWPLGIILVLFPLLFFKYTGFLQNNINIILSALRSARVLSELKIALPLGISFYTFSALGYVIDVLRKKIPQEKDLFHYAVGISFFPCLVSGPIERQNELIPQCVSDKQFDYDKAVYGLKLVSWGLYKKAVLADNLAIYVDAIWSNIRMHEGVTLAIGVFFYSVQIYCDFSGYSDIARGIAKILGIDISVNFNCPYFSTSIQEFWKRWHISLSSWFRDYVYIPLGGNRCGKTRKAANIMITMLVSGLWHGAAWKYVAWGFVHGVLQIIEMLIGKATNIIVKNLNRIIVFAECSLLWVLFRSDSFEDSLYVYLNMFSMKFDFADLVALGLPLKALFILFIEILLLVVFDWISLKRDVIKELSRLPLLMRWLVYVLFVIILAQLSYKGAAGNFVYAGF